MKIISVSQQKEKIFYLIKQFVGAVALIVGVVGIIAPVIPGWLLIFVGLELLGIKIVFIDNIKRYAMRKLESSNKKKESKKK